MEAVELQPQLQPESKLDRQPEPEPEPEPELQPELQPEPSCSSCGVTKFNTKLSWCSGCNKADSSAPRYCSRAYQGEAW